MVQNSHFVPKKAKVWLIPVLLVAGLFSWAQVQGGPQSHAQPIKTELVISTSKGKSTKGLWRATAKRFVPTITTLTEESIRELIQVRWTNQITIYSQIKPNLFFAVNSFWNPRGLTSIISC